MATLPLVMSLTGLAALLAGLILLRPRLATATGPARILLYGPVFSAIALAIFAAEHFLDAHDLMGIVPHWFPFPLVTTYFVGVALLAAAVSFLANRCVAWSASFLALLFLIIVATVDLPGFHQNFHDRFFWILTVRETCFAGGALVLAGSYGAGGPRLSRLTTLIGRFLVAATFVFYAIQHFLHPRNVPGVPLEKLIPAWCPEPVLLSGFIGLTLLLTAPALLLPTTRQRAAAIAGTVLTLLTVFFYIPILCTEAHTPLAVDGVNYVGDTLLFAATALLAGFPTNTTESAPN